DDRHSMPKVRGPLGHGRGTYRQQIQLATLTLPREWLTRTNRSRGSRLLPLLATSGHRRSGGSILRSGHHGREYATGYRKRVREKPAPRSEPGREPRRMPELVKEGVRLRRAAGSRCPLRKRAANRQARRPP